MRKKKSKGSITMYYVNIRNIGGEVLCKQSVCQVTKLAKK